METDLLQGFYLRGWHIDPVKGKVTGQGDSRHLPPKAAEVLLCLARSPGELVTHETLIETAWGTGKGSHEALSHAVSEIRQALDDNRDDPTFIQTLPRRGYRLVVEPQPAEDHTASIVIGAQGGARLDDIGLFENLKRRGVLETGLAYLILGWLLIQVADIVFEQLHLPEWAGTFVTMLVIAGFPVAVVLSWFLEFRDGRAVVDDLSPRDARKRRFSRTYISVVGGLAVAAIGVYAYDRIFGLPGDEEAVQPDGLAEQIELPPVVENSFAVLPFVNLDGSDETQTFADGLVDDVITQLSRVPGLRVASRGDAYTLAPNSASQDVRRRLRVEMYLEGSVEMAADKMRITVQLIDSEDGFHILSRKFDRPKQDFFDVRDEITAVTVANVRVALPENLRASSLKVVEDPTLDAWVLYRKGIEASRLPITIDNIASALGWFDGALNVDPEYAAAHAGKCAQYVRAFAETNGTSYIELARSACATALALNPNLDVVHAALGDLHLATGDYREAETAYSLTLDINPSSAAAMTGLGITYQHTNQLAEAERNLRRAVDIHPGDTSAYNRLGVFLFQTGRFEEAAIQYQYLVALEPNNMRGFTNLGSAYMMQGNFTAAVTAFQKAIDIEPMQNAYSNLGMMHYYLGEQDEAIEAHRKAVELQPKDRLARSNLGDALWAAGKEEEARIEFETAESLAETGLQVNANDPLLLMDLAWIKTALEQHEQAREMIDRAKKLVPTDPFVHYIEGLMHNRVGDTSAAIRSFSNAVQNGYSKSLLAGDPILSELRDDPKFSELLNGSD